jgi:hypothetical protein
MAKYGKWNPKMSRALGRALGERAGEKKPVLDMAAKAGPEHPDPELQRGWQTGYEAERFADEATAIDPNAKRIYDAYDFDYERSYGPAGAYKKALHDSNVDIDEVPTSIEGFEEKYGFDVRDELPDRSKAKEDMLDDMRDRDSDKAVVDNFDKFIKESSERHGYKKWRNEARNQKLDDGLNGEIHNLDREGAVDDIRVQMIQDLRNKMDLSDFFDKWK